MQEPILIDKNAGFLCSGAAEAVDRLGGEAGGLKGILRHGLHRDRGLQGKWEGRFWAPETENGKTHIRTADQFQRRMGLTPDLGDEASEEDQAMVAYKPQKVGGGVNVYYSTIFESFKAQVDQLKTQNPSLSELFRTNDEIWIGYHAILQENSRMGEKEKIEEETLERLLEADRIRVAKMQVKQALHTSELMQKVMRAQSTE